MKYFISIVFFIGLILLGACTKGSGDNDEVIIYSTGAEKIKGEYLTDSMGLSEFTGVTFKTELFSHTGKSSIKLDSSHLYGFGITIEDPKEGELYQASVWQKKGSIDGTLICSIEGQNKRTVRTWNKNVISKDWFKHNLSVIVGKDVDKIK